MGKEVHSPGEWAKVKKEYLGGALTMREISRKYGIAVSAISTRCKKEGWEAVRERIKMNAEQKLVEKISESQATNAELAAEILHKLMEKLAITVDAINPADTSATKQLTQCMKDLADMGVYRVENKDAAIEIGFSEVSEYGD